MSLKRNGVSVLLGVLFLALLIAIFVLPDVLPEISEGETVHVFTRLFALYGFFFLGVATLITPFLTEVTRAFGKPFLKVHHAFSILGIVLITLHPTFNAIDRLSLSVFLPTFASWEVFWQLAGRPAFIILYVAVAAALLRAKAPKYWRFFHALMYIVLLFGIVHANLIGDDFENLGIIVIFNALFIASIVSFAYKRYKNYIKRRLK
jgi:predicted ferric reductase